MNAIIAVTNAGITKKPKNVAKNIYFENMKIEIKKIPLSEIENNTGQIEGVPKNPRFIRDEKYNALVKSLKDFPEMITIRELVVVPNNNKYVVVGGNMRLRGLKEVGEKETICKILMDFPPEKIREFSIKDNEGYGATDWDIIANEWDTDELEEWGVDLPVFDEGEEIPPEPDELTSDNNNKPPVLKITFENTEQLQKAEIDIQELIDRKYKGAFFSVSCGEL